MTNAELKEWIELHIKGVKAEVRGGNDAINIQLKQIVNRQDIANHRVTKLETETGFACWINKNKKFAAIVLVALIFIVDFLTDSVGLDELIKLIK